MITEHCVAFSLRPNATQRAPTQKGHLGPIIPAFRTASEGDEFKRQVGVPSIRDFSTVTLPAGRTEHRGDDLLDHEIHVGAMASCRRESGSL